MERIHVACHGAREWSGLNDSFRDRSFDFYTPRMMKVSHSPHTGGKPFMQNDPPWFVMCLGGILLSSYTSVNSTSPKHRDGVRLCHFASDQSRYGYFHFCVVIYKIQVYELGSFSLGRRSFAPSTSIRLFQKLGHDIPHQLNGDLSPKSL
jgi:hypothetical protein